MAAWDWLTGGSNGAAASNGNGAQAAANGNGDSSWFNPSEWLSNIGFGASNTAEQFADFSQMSPVQAPQGPVPDAPVASNWSLLDPSSWGIGTSTPQGPPAPSAQASSGWSLFDPSSWFGGGDAVSNAGAAGATVGTAAQVATQQQQGNWLSNLFGNLGFGNNGNAATPPTAPQDQSWLDRAGNFVSGIFGGGAANAGEQAADQMLTAIMAGQSAAQSVGANIQDMWGGLFGSGSGANDPGMFDALNAMTTRLQSFAQGGSPAESQAAQQAIAALQHLDPGTVTSDVVSGVKNFFTFGGNGGGTRDRTANTADVVNTPPDVSAIPDYQGGGGNNYPMPSGGGGGNLGLQQVSNTTSTGVWGALWSDNPEVVTAVGPAGILQLETNTPLLKRSIVLLGMRLPISILAIIIGLCFYYRKALSKWFQKLIKK